MSERVFLKLFLINSKFSFVLASNLKTRLGVVLDALNKPQPVSDSILTPSIKMDVQFS